MPKKKPAPFPFCHGVYYTCKTDKNGTERVVKVVARFKTLSTNRVCVIDLLLINLDMTNLFQIDDDMIKSEMYNVMRTSRLYEMEVWECDKFGYTGPVPPLADSVMD